MEGDFLITLENEELVEIDYKDTISTKEERTNNYSSYEKELNHMLCMLKELKVPSLKKGMTHRLKKMMTV